MRVTVRATPLLRCAYCHDALLDEPAPCSGCGTHVHDDCRALAGECPTLGCRPMVITVAGPRPATPWLARALERCAPLERLVVGGVFVMLVLVVMSRLEAAFAPAAPDRSEPARLVSDVTAPPGGGR